MLIGLTIRDVVLIDALELEVGKGLTVLTGETGAGKSIVLDALGLALGQRADAALVRRGAAQAVATAAFSLSPDHPAWAFLEARGLQGGPDEPLILRRQLAQDGRSRAFINDQSASVSALRELGALLIEVHGQHETVGLLDARSHGPLLDGFGAVAPAAKATQAAWRAYAAARDARAALAERAQRGGEDLALQAARLEEIDRLNPRPGEETALVEERALLGAAEKALADIAAAQTALGGDQISSSLAQALRALDRARERTLQAGAGADNQVVLRLKAASEALDRALVETDEALAAVEAAASAFEFEPDRLDGVEQRLFALRALARRLGVPVEAIPEARAELAKAVSGAETLEADLEALSRAEAAARALYEEAALGLTRARTKTGLELAAAVMAELAPLKLEKARFRVAVEPLAPERAGPHGRDQVEFQVATNPGAPFGALGAIASGGELARFALALKAVLSRGGEGPSPTMIFDEVDQGVGGAVADAVGLRLRALARGAQVILVTHSPQIAARADAHWRVSKTGAGEGLATRIAALGSSEREEEIARMLSGAEITQAARAAARALMDA